MLLAQGVALVVAVRLFCATHVYARLTVRKAVYGAKADQVEEIRTTGTYSQQL